MQQRKTPRDHGQKMLPGPLWRSEKGRVILHTTQRPQENHFPNLPGLYLTMFEALSLFLRQFALEFSSDSKTQRLASLPGRAWWSSLLYTPRTWCCGGTHPSVGLGLTLAWLQWSPGAGMGVSRLPLLPHCLAQCFVQSSAQHLWNDCQGPGSVRF